MAVPEVINVSFSQNQLLTAAGTIGAIEGAHIAYGDDVYVEGTLESSKTRDWSGAITSMAAPWIFELGPVTITPVNGDSSKKDSKRVDKITVTVTNSDGTSNEKIAVPLPDVP